MALSLGLGFTNRCNLHCAHCYRDENLIADLSLDDVTAVISSAPWKSVNLGTGENGLHPNFPELLNYLFETVPKTTITSNGHSIAVLSDAQLRGFSNVEFSIDFPNQTEQDDFRGPGNWTLVHEQARRCHTLGVSTTITAVMMSVNFDRLHLIAKTAAELGATFRVNVYQPVQGDVFSLTYEQVWEGFRTLLAHTRLVTTSEPILAAALEMESFEGCGCGRSTVRLSPTGHVLPCVYVPNGELTARDIVAQGESIVAAPEFEAFRSVPSACASCDFVTWCRGGCAGRRVLRGSPDEVDPYCPKISNIRLSADWANHQDLPKSGSACTTIVEYVAV